MIDYKPLICFEGLNASHFGANQFVLAASCRFATCPCDMTGPVLQQLALAGDLLPDAAKCSFAILAGGHLSVSCYCLATAGVLLCRACIIYDDMHTASSRLLTPSAAFLQKHKEQGIDWLIQMLI